MLIKLIHIKFTRFLKTYPPQINTHKSLIGDRHLGVSDSGSCNRTHTRNIYEALLR